MAKTYDDGLRDGKIESVENMQVAQNVRLDGHDGKIATLEKAVYGVMAIIVFIEFLPQLKSFVGVINGN